MRRNRARTVAAVLGLLALAALAGGFGPLVIEQRYIWRLDSDDEAVRRAAAEALGERRSVRAVPMLLGLLIDPEFHTVESETAIRQSNFRLAVVRAEAVRGRISPARSREVSRRLRERARSSLPNAFALDALFQIGQPARAYAETLDTATDDVRADFVVTELRESIARQDPSRR